MGAGVFIRCVPPEFAKKVASGALKVCGNLIRDPNTNKIVGQLVCGTVSQVAQLPLSGGALASGLVSNVQNAILLKKTGEIQKDLGVVATDVKSILNSIQGIGNTLNGVAALSGATVLLSCAGIATTVATTALMMKRIDAMEQRTTERLSEISKKSDVVLNKIDEMLANQKTESQLKTREKIRECTKAVKNCQSRLKGDNHIDTECSIHELEAQLLSLVDIFCTLAPNDWGKCDDELSAFSFLDTINAVYGYLIMAALTYQNQEVSYSGDKSYVASDDLKDVLTAMQQKKMRDRIVQCLALYAPTLMSEAEIAEILAVYDVSVEQQFEALESLSETQATIAPQDAEKISTFLQEKKKDESEDFLVIYDNEDGIRLADEIGLTLSPDDHVELEGQAG